MASRFDRMSDLEKRSYRIWIGGASHVHYGLCDVCQRTRNDDDDTPLLVARQERARKFLCLSCWDIAN